MTVTTLSDPGAPTQVTATVGQDGVSATVTWLPPAAPLNATITGYRVERDGFDSQGTGPWWTIVGAGDRSWPFTKLVPGTAYTFTVRAIIQDGSIDHPTNCAPQSFALAIPQARAQTTPIDTPTP